jgi:hypothetical protein
VTLSSRNGFDSGSGSLSGDGNLTGNEGIGNTTGDMTIEYVKEVAGDSGGSR